MGRDRVDRDTTGRDMARCDTLMGRDRMGAGLFGTKW
jgi:hypothetical protein